MSIRELAQNRCGKELHDRIHGQQEAEHDVARARRQVSGEQVVWRGRVSEKLRDYRHQNSDAQGVKDDRKDNDPDRLLSHRQWQSCGRFRMP